MKVAIYCRLSEEDKNKVSKESDSESIQNQKSMLIKYTLEHDWELYDIYSDDDYAGADRNRPAFKKLLEDAEARKFDIILCKTLSRFTRELEIVEKYIHGLFPIWGIRFISVVDNSDTDNKGNKKARQINGLINEWYLEDLSENIKSVFNNKRKEGYHIGAFALYGYLKDPNQKGHLIIDEEAAQIVREVFILFSKGYGKTTIAQMLNERNVPNPTEYKRLKGLRYSPPKTKKATLWKYFAIADMLVNEIYIGNMVQGKYGSISYKSKINKPRPKSEWYVVENTHEAIIDKELWDTVQAMIKQRAKPFASGKIGLFAKKVKCQHCGYTLRSCKKNEHYYLKCSTKHVAKDACIGSFISVKKLEQAILEELSKFSQCYIDKQELETCVSISMNYEKKLLSINNEIKGYEEKVEEHTEALKYLYFDKLKGIINENDFIQMSKDFNKDRKKLLLLIEELKNDREITANKMASQNNRQEIINKYMHLEKLTREIVEILIDYIEIGKKDTETKIIPITIHWNF